MNAVSKEIFEALKEFFLWLCKSAIKGLVSQSYWICLFTCMMALILYISGMKKAGKYVSVSFVIYFFLQCIKEVVNK